MPATFTAPLLSLKVREEATVNCAEPALMLDDGVLQPPPEAITSCAAGVRQLMPTLPAVSINSLVELLVTIPRFVVLTEPRKVRPVCAPKKSFSVPFEAPKPVWAP